MATLSAPAGLPVLWPGGARIVVLVRHNVALLAREPGPVIARLLQPLALILLLRSLYVSALASDGVQAGTAQAVTGMLVVFSLLALSVVSTAILAERKWGTWDRLRVTSARSVEMILGKAVPAFAMLALQQIVVMCFGVVVFGLRVVDPGLLAVAVTSWALALLGMGAMLGAVMRSLSELNAAYDIGGVLLSALGGALVPLTLLPGWAQRMAPASPGYWAMSALRSALLGQIAPTLRAASVLCAVAAIMGTIAAWRVQHGWTRSRLL